MSTALFDVADHHTGHGDCLEFWQGTQQRIGPLGKHSKTPSSTSKTSFQLHHTTSSRTDALSDLIHSSLNLLSHSTCLCLGRSLYHWLVHVMLFGASMMGVEYLGEKKQERLHRRGHSLTAAGHLNDSESTLLTASSRCTTKENKNLACLGQ